MAKRVEADRSPDHSYKTMNLAGIFVRERGLFMKPENQGRYHHDGRFATLLDVVNSYNDPFGLGRQGQRRSFGCGRIGCRVCQAGRSSSKVIASKHFGSRAPSAEHAPPPGGIAGI